ncbi:MAG: hypothetical protein AB7P14_06650 [Blastocatellales bacterium]
MSEEELRKREAAARQRGDISTEEGLAAAEIIFKQAEKEGVICALAGGIAMHLYGYLRATHDVNLIATKSLDLPFEEKLSFGGHTHSVQVGTRKIMVDVIVRDDLFRDFYEAALKDARRNEEGWLIIKPEWMVILKYMAGRSKDILDLLWMLREPGLVDRDKVAQLLEQVLGKLGAEVALRGLENYYVQAEVMRAGDEHGRQE